jgi:hypothetical protein
MSKSKHPFEADIGLFFSFEPMASDSRNHCVPIYEVLQPPDEDRLILVMPLLKNYRLPQFDTSGEVVEFSRQMFEVISDRMNIVESFIFVHSRACSISNSITSLTGEPEWAARCSVLTADVDEETVCT